MVLCSDPRHATPRRGTSTTNGQHLWRQTSLYGSGGTFQAPLSRHTAARLPDNLDRTPSILAPPSVSTIIVVFIYPTTCAGRHRRFPSTLQPLCNDLRRGVLWGPPTWRFCSGLPSGAASSQCGAPLDSAHRSGNAGRHRSGNAGRTTLATLVRGDAKYSVTEAGSP
jgi:hypothetical protein